MRERLEHVGGHRHVLFGARDAGRLTPTAVATDRGCRCWSSRRTQGELRQRRPDRPVLGGQLRRGRTGSREKRLGKGSFDGDRRPPDAPGGVLNFHTRPHYQALILNPTSPVRSVLEEGYSGPRDDQLKPGAPMRPGFSTPRLPRPRLRAPPRRPPPPAPRPPRAQRRAAAWTPRATQERRGRRRIRAPGGERDERANGKIQ